MNMRLDPVKYCTFSLVIMKGLVVGPGNHSQQGNIFLTKHKLDFSLGHITDNL